MCWWAKSLKSGEDKTPTPHPFSILFPSSRPFQWTLPLLSTLLPPGPPRTCAAPSSTPASWKRQVRARAEYSHLREPFGKVLKPRVLEALCTLCFRHRLLTDLPLTHQELVYICELIYHLPFTTNPSSLLISKSTLLLPLS